MTYGELKLRLVKAFPGVDVELIKGWIADRYAEILGEINWSRLVVDSVLVTTAPYTVGTVALTAGSSSVTLTGGTWTSAMTGRAFRVASRDEFYEFTLASSTTGTLDRPYEGSTASGAGYSIFQHIYPLPSDCRLLKEDAFSGPFGPLKRFSHGELNAIDSQRVQKGTPQSWASYMDDSSTPPRMQVEVYPVPDTSIGIPFTYYGDADPLSASSTILQVWLQPTALVEGVTAKIKRHLKDYTGAQLATADAAMALKNMRTSEAQGLGPARMHMDSYFTRHRTRRTCR